MIRVRFFHFERWSRLKKVRDLWYTCTCRVSVWHTAVYMPCFDEAANIVKSVFHIGIRTEYSLQLHELSRFNFVFVFVFCFCFSWFFGFFYNTLWLLYFTCCNLHPFYFYHLHCPLVLTLQVSRMEEIMKHIAFLCALGCLFLAQANAGK